MITTSGKLPCSAVIHTEDGRREENEDTKLRKAVQSSLGPVRVRWPNNNSSSPNIP